MRRDWAIILSEGGFGGITFCQRTDVKFGVRPMPYYEIDGDLDLLQEIKNQLFSLGINSTINESKYFNSLQVHGVKNCIILSEVLGLDDKWTDTLHEDFKTGCHLTEEGIKKLHIEFASEKTLSYEAMCEIIARAKERHTQKQQEILHGSRKKLLPRYDPLYKDISNECCAECGSPDIQIYFAGEAPKPWNIFYLCKKCAAIL